MFRVLCFAKIEDQTPVLSFEADDYLADVDPVRLVTNPKHLDPKKQIQLHVASGERNLTDPLRFERIQVMSATHCVWGRDSNGGNYAEPEMETRDAE